MKNITLNFVVALIVFALPMAVHAAGNAAEGKKKAASCAACHGEAGAKPIQPDYPLLAGQHEDYLAAALTQYKSGKRQNAIMKGFAAALSAQDIKDLSAYYAREKSVLKMKY